MAFAFVDSVSNRVAGASSIDASHSFPIGVLLVGVYAFQGVAAGSGPWGDPNIGQYAADHIGPASGWQRACWSAPSAAGVGIEVWTAINGTTDLGPRTLAFTGAQTCQLVMGAYSGAYAPSGSIRDGAVRVATTAQVIGNAPPAPAVLVNAGELIVAVGGDLMTVAKFGTPAGYTNRIDVAAGGVGTVEATIADVVAAAAGETGLIVFPNAAAASSTAGTTATLAIVPAPSGASVGPILDVAMPADLDLGDGWTLRVTALDPTTGAVVPGVKVSNVAIEVVDVNNVGVPGLESGDWLLVPGTGA